MSVIFGNNNSVNENVADIKTLRDGGTNRSKLDWNSIHFLERSLKIYADRSFASNDYYSSDDYEAAKKCFDAIKGQNSIIIEVEVRKLEEFCFHIPRGGFLPVGRLVYIFQEVSTWLLGYCYARGIGVQSDPTKANTYIKAASDEGFIPAKVTLGQLMTNREEAFKLFFEVADLGCAEAEYEVGKCYEYGFGTTADPYKAIMYYALAAGKNNAYALVKVPELAASLDVKISHELFYSLAANLGHPDAIVKMSGIYSERVGIASIGLNKMREKP